MRRLTAALVAAAMVLAVIVPVVAFASSSPSPTAMLRGQVNSQTNIKSLLGVSGGSSSWIKTITFGTVKKTSSQAIVPITVRTAGGTTVKGTLVLRKYSGKWYAYAVNRGSRLTPDYSGTKIPSGLTTKVIAGAISAQGSHQYLITGIISGGYKKITVTSRHTFSNAKQVSIKLSGGSRAATTGRVLAYRKTASGKSYWFISAIK